MKQQPCENFAMTLRGQSSGRLADFNNLPKPRWRDALVALAAPATRVHEYRNLHKAMFYRAMCEIDRKECT